MTNVDNIYMDYNREGPTERKLMDFKPEDLYPVHEVAVPPKMHLIGKGLLGLVLASVATKAASVVYDFGLAAYRQKFGSE